jgi:hemerythrin-like domain-containing protein
MFQPTQILRDEHEIILRGLDLLADFSEKLNDGVPVAPDKLDSIIEFFRLYADKTHHGKEEALLFPAMVAKGFSYETGPIHCMMADHEQNRTLTRAMIAEISGMRAGDSRAPLRFAEAAHRYIQGLREHIQKENMVLFNMAEQVLLPSEEPSLLAQFHEVDNKEIGREEIQRLIRILDRVAEPVPVR